MLILDCLTYRFLPAAVWPVAVGRRRCVCLFCERRPFARRKATFRPVICRLLQCERRHIAKPLNVSVLRAYLCSMRKLPMRKSAVYAVDGLSTMRRVCHVPGATIPLVAIGASGRVTVCHNPWVLRPAPSPGVHV